MISRSLLMVIMAIGLAACANAPKFINKDYQLVLPDAEYKSRLEYWFNCDECVNGQLRRVQELGNAAVPDLAAARGGTMIQVGGADLSLADGETVLPARCMRIASTIVPVGVTPAQTVDECVNRFRANRDRRYRARASIALLAIRTKSACAELGVDANGNPVCEVFKPFHPPIFIPDSDRSTRNLVF